MASAGNVARDNISLLIGHYAPMDGLISICIPTYKRAALIVEALDSCLAQSYPEVEILIGDDSPDEETKKVVIEYQKQYPGKIHYEHNKPALGQAGNVNRLFGRAKGSRLILLHDDDLLMPDAVERMASVWQELPTVDAVFGKQVRIDNDGQVLGPERTDTLNVSYNRIPSKAGRQQDPIVAGVQRMFPNDGYMISTALAVKTGYRPRAEVGEACDMDFGIRACAAARDVWFLDEYTVKCRITRESVGNSSLLAPAAYDLLLNLRVSPAISPVLTSARREDAPSAVSGFARMGRSKRAWDVFWSDDYPRSVRWSVRGAYHLMLILRSLFKRA